MLNHVLSVSETITDVGCLIEEISKQYVESSSEVDPKKFDYFLFNTCRALIVILREAVLSTEEQSEVISHPYFEEGYKQIAQKFSKDCHSSSDSRFVRADLSERVRLIFNFSKEKHSAVVQNILLKYNQGSCLADLKMHLDELARDCCNGYTRNDFKSEEQYRAFKKNEITKLSQLLSLVSTPQNLDLVNYLIYLS